MAWEHADCRRATTGYISGVYAPFILYILLLSDFAKTTKKTVWKALLISRKFNLQVVTIHIIS